MTHQHRVAVVVDPDYGEAVRLLSRDRHVWIVRSSRNDEVVDSLRAGSNEHSLESGISTFAASGTPEESLLSILGTVEELADGFGQIEPDGEGFTAYRTL
jgi:hypothetical protein